MSCLTATKPTITSCEGKKINEAGSIVERVQQEYVQRVRVTRNEPQLWKIDVPDPNRVHQDTRSSQVGRKFCN